jgi:hypothetical protein
MTITFLEDFEDRLRASIWHSGPPPSIGWWPASIYGQPTVVRWWNGQCWSYPLSSDCDEIEVQIWATIISRCQDKIRWQQRPKDWPLQSLT